MSNIYLNEFDRFIKHQLRPLAYLRYGDDWLCFVSSKDEAKELQKAAILFLEKELHLTINPRINIIQPVYRGISYLGVHLWPHHRILQPNVRARAMSRLNHNNAGSYRDLIMAYDKQERLKELDWSLLNPPHR